MDHIYAFLDEFDTHRPADGSIPDAMRAVLDRPQVYARSLDAEKGVVAFLARVNDDKMLLVRGEGSTFDAFEGEAIRPGLKVCPMNASNAATLRATFSYTAPRSLADERATFGTGDRLGVATPGHVMAVGRFDALPVLAQQSTRELSLTGGRTFQDVVDCASWGVFERHFTSGFGADGDHLKTDEEIVRTLGMGAKMLTLDASEHIDNDVLSQSTGQVQERYLELPSRVRKPFEKRYLDRKWDLRDKRGKKLTIEFDGERLARTVLIYHRMIEFAARIFKEHVEGKGIDFEVSIDETLTSTDPAAHFLVSNELIESGVAIWSLAPRFCGEFQKGIDYIGELSRFEDEFAVHAAIADYFGYKLSIHSGSDKFSVFPIIGNYTNGRLHAKTAGTSWLEATRLVAMKDASLFREMYTYALDHFDETRPYYHVSAEPEYCPKPESLGDADLPGLLDQDDPRQILHTTYGVLLQAKDGGSPLFRDRFYAVLDQHEDAHYALLDKHLSRHLDTLKIERI